MKAKIKIDKEVKEAYAVIYTSEITEEVQRAVTMLDAKSDYITARDRDKIVILKPEEIFMVRVENSETIIYCLNKQYNSKRRLYELLARLGSDFMQISKCAVINLKKIDFVEPSISGMMLLYLKNKQSEYISRKYLPEFKRYIGL